MIDDLCTLVLLFKSAYHNKAKTLKSLINWLVRHSTRVWCNDFIMMHNKRSMSTTLISQSQFVGFFIKEFSCYIYYDFVQILFSTMNAGSWDQFRLRYLVWMLQFIHTCLGAKTNDIFAIWLIKFVLRVRSLSLNQHFCLNKALISSLCRSLLRISYIASEIVDSLKTKMNSEKTLDLFLTLRMGLEFLSYNLIFLLFSGGLYVKGKKRLTKMTLIIICLMMMEVIEKRM